jgi:hypothetical protein
MKTREGIEYIAGIDDSYKLVPCNDKEIWVIIFHPDNSPLMVNVETGSVKRLEATE